MIPVLYAFTAESTFGLVIFYTLGLAIIGYAAWSGWRGVDALDAKATEAQKAKHSRDRITRAVIFGAIGAGVARLGLYYALPPNEALGGRGFGIPIHTYGIMFAGGFIAAVTLASQLAQREWRGDEGLHKRDQIFDLAFWVFLGGYGGSRVLFTIVNWSDYSGHWLEYLSSPTKLVDCLSGGLVFYGGLIGATVVSFVYTRRNKFDFFRLADLAIPTVSLGQCLGRLGCFSAGCCWGDIGGDKLKWGLHFPGTWQARNIFGQLSNTSSLAFQSQAADSRWVIESTGQVFHQAVPGAVRISAWAAEHGHTLPVHPTQLYESLGQFILFCALVSLRKYRRFHGQIFGIWLMCYAALRTTVELFRGDVERGTLNGLLHFLGADLLAEKVPLEAWYNISTSQFISLCMFAFGASILYRRGRGTLFQATPRSATPSPA